MFKVTHKQPLTPQMSHILSLTFCLSLSLYFSQLFWAYIQAMLTNLESMTLERIHTMLRMFVSSGPVVTEMEIGELQAFLDKKVRDHQLISSAGVYRLPKSPHH